MALSVWVKRLTARGTRFFLGYLEALCGASLCGKAGIVPAGTAEMQILEPQEKEGLGGGLEQG